MTKYNKDCLFCKIIKGKIPCYKVYEDKDFLAFLDINPIAKGHTLVIPKKHFTNLLDADDKYLKKMLPVVKKIMLSYKEKLGCTGFNILNANEKSGQQSVFHLHIHIVPRFDNDGFNTWPITGYQKEDLTLLSEKLRL
ncbi:MAG: HIT family protein [archaeon]